MEDIYIGMKLNRKGITRICNLLKVLGKCLIIVTICLYIYSLVASFQFFMNSVAQLHI